MATNNAYTAVGNLTNVEIKEAPLPCLIAITITAALCIVLFFFPEPLHTLTGLLPV